MRTFDGFLHGVNLGGSLKPTISPPLILNNLSQNKTLPTLLR